MNESPTCQGSPQTFSRTYMTRRLQPSPMAAYSSRTSNEQGAKSSLPMPAAPGSRAWVALAMLCCIYILNFLSRQLPAILAKPIQDDLHISDGQLGLIGGFYFALFYCCISIPVGWLADKTNRSRILALACAIWSLATMLCGMTGNYLEFVFAYMTVGFGEAGGVPPSYSIITDYFPTGRRGTALGLFNLGPGIGAALGIAFGASIAAAFNWRYAFILLGAVGVFAAVCVLLLVREPRRGGLDRIPDHATKGNSGFRQTFVMFFSRPSLLWVALGSGANQFITYGLSNFTVLFLMREKGMGLRQIATWYSLVVLIGMSGSMFVSGRLIDRFTRNSKSAYALIPAASLTLAVPLYLGFVRTPSWWIALPLLVATIFLNYFYLSSAVTLVQEEVRPDQRVMSGALLLLVMNFIGLGLGPTFVGAASDFFRKNHSGHSLQMALYALAPFYIIAIGIFLKLAGVLRKQSFPVGGIVQ